MADILIRGVGIPKPNEGPYIMWVYPDGKTIVYSYVVNGNGFSTDSQKVIETKAVPLPEGHWRLIDANDIHSKLFDEYRGAISDSQLYVYEVLGMIEEADTILEAEGGKADG